MVRTENAPRQKSLCSAEVIKMYNLSETVKGLTLFLKEPERKNAVFKVSVCMLIGIQGWYVHVREHCIWTQCQPSNYVHELHSCSYVWFVRDKHCFLKSIKDLRRTEKQ